MKKLMPGQKCPDLKVPLVQGGDWSLQTQSPQSFTMLVFYRGLHCPICRDHLRKLKSLKDSFEEKGVDVLILSSDVRERAQDACVSWDLTEFDFGYGLSFETAAEWGLYASKGIGATSLGIEEPDLFTEPGLFLVRPNGQLYFATVQTMPFTRPDFGQVLRAVEYAVSNEYPARGEAVIP